MGEASSWSKLSSSELLDWAQRVTESPGGNLTKAKLLIEAAGVRATQEAALDLSHQLTQMNFAMSELGFAAQRVQGQ